MAFRIFLRSGFDALANLVQTAAPQELQIFERQPRDQVGRRLDAPLKIRACAHQSFGNVPRAIEIDQEVVVHHPQHLQVVTPRQIDRLLHKLFGGSAFHLRP